MNDWELLQEWAGKRSETAFAQIVQRHVDFVHACARRQTNRPDLAEEVTQGVFLLLSQKAGGFGAGIILTSWLFRTTRFLAARAIRAESRRHHHESAAAAMNQIVTANDTPEPADLWAGIEPHLDAAVAALPPLDRDAVLLRYFERKPMREIGTALGVQEEAAKKRVNRAVAKLRDILVRRGVAVTAASLAAILSVPPRAEASEVSAALAAGIAAAIAGTGAAPAAAVIELAKGGGRDWFWAVARAWVPLAAAGAVLVVGLGIGVARLSGGIGKTVRDVAAGAFSRTTPRLRSAMAASGAPLNPSGIALTVLDEATGEPVNQAQIMAEYYGARGLESTEDLATDAMGAAVVKIGAARPQMLRVWIAARRHAPVVMQWQEHEFIEPLLTHTCRLPAGRTLRGEVRDAGGRPISGAEVTVHGFGLDLSSRENVGYHPRQTAAITDADGRFFSDQQPDRLPAQGGGIYWSVAHPHYAWGTFSATSLTAMDSNQVVILEDGVRVLGRVTAEGGRPVAQAYLAESLDSIQRYQSTNANDQGEFVLGPFRRGPLRIEAMAPGYDRMTQTFAVSNDMERINLELKPRANPLEGSPADPMAQEFRIEGKVADAATGLPISQFKVLRGQGGFQNLVGFGHDGAFDWDLQAFLEPQIFLTVNAEGYEPAGSGARSTADGFASFEFRLERGLALRGRILQPDGQPAALAAVGLIGLGYSVRFQPPAGMVNLGAAANQTRSDARGGFRLDSMPKMESVLFIHETGCAVLPAESVTNVLVRLQAWGEIEGTCQLGGQARPGETINAGFGVAPDASVQIPFDINGKTDETGHFRLQRVPPGRHMVQRLINPHPGAEGEIGFSHGRAVSVGPGETVHVRLGGEGRTITGRLAMFDTGKEFSWAGMLPRLEEIVETSPEPPAPTAGPGEILSARYLRDHTRWHNSRRRYYLEMRADGAFRVDDVPAGHYLMFLQVFAPADLGAPDYTAGLSQGPLLGVVNVPLQVTAADNPLDLGLIPVTAVQQK